MPRFLRAALVGLGFPLLLSLVASGVVLYLIPRAPDTIVMQWSGDGAVREAGPSELIFLPFIAMAMSAIVWMAVVRKRRDARSWVVIGNSVNAVFNAVAVSLIASQLSAPAVEGLPIVVPAAALLAGTAAGAVTVLNTRTRLE